MFQNTKFVVAFAGVHLSGLIDVCNAVTATFDGGNGVSGYVDVNSGNIEIYLDLSLSEPNDSFVALPNEDCITYGLKYSVNTQWNHGDSNDFLGTNCSRTYTNGDYDPWLACSASTSNEYCNSSSINKYNSCVYGSSASDLSSNVYSCSESSFASNPYVCEVGDWSGKYGKIYFGQDTLVASETYSSAFEIIDENDLIGKSIVFYCGNTNEPAFCAPFEDIDNSVSSSQTRPTQCVCILCLNFFLPI